MRAYSLSLFIQRNHTQKVKIMSNENEDIPLFSYDGTLGYNTGSDTSLARMKSEQGVASTKQAVILELFRQAGVCGLVSSEAEEKTGWKHQTVSSHIRNMELAGVLCKTEVIRNKQHVYIHKIHAIRSDAPKVVEPTPMRSWRKKYDALSDEIEMLLEKYIDLYHDSNEDPRQLIFMHQAIQGAIIRHKIKNRI